MNKLGMLLTCASITLMAAIPAKAVEVKPFGIIEFTLEKGQNTGTYPTPEGGYGYQDSRQAWNNHGDSYHPKTERATQRFILGAQFIVSEALSAHFDVIAGYFTWGGPHGTGAPFGGHLGSRASNIVTRQAYLDWMVPNTNIKVRMGDFFWVAPQYAVGTVNPFDGNETGTGIQISTPINAQVSVTAGWLRAASDSRRNTASTWGTSHHDLMDLFVLSVPIRLEGMRFTPWGAYGMLGRDSSSYSGVNYGSVPTSAGFVFGDALSAGGSSTEWGDWYSTPGIAGWKWLPLRNAAVHAAINRGSEDFNRGKSTLYFAALGGEFTLWDPFRFAFDLGYSGIDTQHSYTDRSGWMAGMSAQYRTNYGTPTLKAWYASGDDGNINNGSERPIVTGAWNTGARLAFTEPSVSNMPTGSGKHSPGTWGLSLQWRDYSFINKLSHSLHVTYVQGTNHKSMAAYADPRYLGYYMTTADSLVDVTLETMYQMYQNFTVGLELGYVFQNFSGSTWAKGMDPATGSTYNRTRDGNSRMRFSNAALGALNFRYIF